MAAESFLEGLKVGDKIGVLSFATSATSPLDTPLTPDFQTAKNAINKIAIEKGDTQYTNIYDALHQSWEELVSGRAEDNSSKVLVLLTDGVATYPRDPVGGKTEAEDIVYASNAALNEAALIKKEGIEIYTIGLGNQINEMFMKNLASKASNFFFAPQFTDLLKIYQDISSDICREVPARIEITYKILDV